MTDIPLEICCVIAGLGPGGSERVMVTLASEWIRSGHRVTLITLADPESDFFGLPAGIRRVGLDELGDSASRREAAIRNIRRIRALRSAIVSTRADVIISFANKTNALVILAATATGIPVIVSERNHPDIRRSHRVWDALRRLTYPFATSLVIQTQAARSWAVGLVGRERVVVIPNPLARRFQGVYPDVTRHRRVIAMGRFSHQKGLDVLIRAFAQITLVHPEWTLRLIGEGLQEATLRSLATESVRPGQIEFRPPVQDPEREFDSTAIFVLPSRFEGFPNVLIEAMARKCAVVATDCAWGPSEIITHGRDGLLVPPEDSTALAMALDKLMRSEGTRRELGAAAVTVRDRFEVSRVASHWVRLMRDTALSRVRRR